MELAKLKRERLGFLSLAILLVYSSHAVPSWLSLALRDNFLESRIGYDNLHAVWGLMFSVILIAHDPVGYGLRLGTVRERWPWILALCVLPIALTWLVYPRLPSKPFTGGPDCLWLISPLAQDLLFAGYFYQRFMELFPGSIKGRLPLARTIPITAAYFALWHTVNFLSMSAEFVCFQLVYAFAGACLMGVIRQFTGSMVYITFVHMAVNWIAVNY